MCSVSAIVPVYNVKKYVERCFDSILTQTRPFDSIIIVNDGSNDGSEKICEEYCKNNKSMILINKNNGGLVSAWKEGLKVLRSDYVCFIDSDDFIASDYLETLLASVDDSVDMVCMNCTQIDDEGIMSTFRINGLEQGEYDVADAILGKMLSDDGSFIRPVASSRWAKLIRSSLVEKYAEFCTEKISYGEDQQLTLGVLLGSKKIRIIDEYKYYYQYNRTSILHTYKSNLWEKIELLMDTIKNIPEINTIPRFERQFHLQYMLYLCECLRNEAYNHSLTRDKYYSMVNSGIIQIALNDEIGSKMRKIDQILIKAAKKKQFSKTVIMLNLYIFVYKIRGIQG